VIDKVNNKAAAKVEQTRPKYVAKVREAGNLVGFLRGFHHK